MSKLLPFVNRPVETIKVIGNDRTGQLHLVSLQGVTPNENPGDFQEQQKKQQKFLLRLTQRIKKLATDEGIPVPEMRKRVMGAMSPESDPLNNYQIFVSSVRKSDPEFSKKSNIIYLLRLQDTWVLKITPENNDQNTYTYYLNQYSDGAFVALQQYLIETYGESKPWPVTESLSTEQLSKLKFLINKLQLKEITDDDNQLFDYLDEETADLLFALQEDKAKLAIRAATFMLKYRVAYPVVAAESAMVGAKSLMIQVPQTAIEKNTSIRFAPNKYVESLEMVVPGLGEYESLIIDDLSFQIEENDTGFICDKGTRKLKIGFHDWEEKDTRDNLPEELISMLYNFYQIEAGILVESDENDEDEGDEDGGNLLMSSLNQLPQNQLTGETSTTDSNGLESQTVASHMKILETNPAG